MLGKSFLIFAAARQRLGRMKAQAEQLSQRVPGTTAAVLQVVAKLTFDDADVLLNTGRLPPDMIASLSTATGLQSTIVDDVTTGILRRDLSDFSVEHERLLKRFTDERCLVDDVASFLEELGPGQVFFLLHGVLAVWNERTGFLNDFIIEDDGSDDGFDEIVAGYLIQRNSGFETSLDLLAASFEQQWPNWNMLWSWF